MRAPAKKTWAVGGNGASRQAILSGTDHFFVQMHKISGQCQSSDTEHDLLLLSYKELKKNATKKNRVLLFKRAYYRTL